MGKWLRFFFTMFSTSVTTIFFQCILWIQISGRAHTRSGMHDGKKWGGNPIQVQTHANKTGRLQSQQLESLLPLIYTCGKSTAKGPDLWKGACKLHPCHGTATDTHVGAASTIHASSLHWLRLHQPRSISASQRHPIAHHQKPHGRPANFFFAHPPFATPPPNPS